MQQIQPGLAEIIHAQKRIQSYIHHTPLLRCEQINILCGAEVLFKAEHLQKAGAFKSRGAANAVFKLKEEGFAGIVATHSSGNHAQALARAARATGLKAHVVMPDNSSPAKVSAVRSYGADISFCSASLESREAELKKVIASTAATEVHPYNDLNIIAGQASCCLEILHETDPDIILAPIGGGGLMSGTLLARYFTGSRAEVIGAEPFNANDAAQSLSLGKLVPSVAPDTIADGLRTSLGSITWPIIRDHINDILTVSEEAIIDAMKIMWERAKIMAEPSSAVPLAAILQNPHRFRNRRVVIIVSGGNVDLNNLPWK